MRNASRKRPRHPAMARRPRPAHGLPRSARTCRTCCSRNSRFVFNRSKGCSRLFALSNWHAMPRYLVKLAVFLVGLAAVCGIAIGYIASNALAFGVTLLIGGCYVAGAVELRRFQQTTDAFAQALDALNTQPKSLAVWI